MADAPWTTIAPLVIDAREVPGHLAELGVFRGATFVHLAAEALWRGCLAVGVDSFEGMAPPSDRDGDHYPAGKFGCGGRTPNLPPDLARHAVFLKGFVPEVLAQADPAWRFAFGHVDLDHWRPTREALEWLWPRTSPGGIVACHDYLPGLERLATLAVDEFAETHGLRFEIVGSHAVLRKGF